mgnify:CR=1 FL=1
MDTALHDRFTAKAGEPVRLIFNVVDQDGNAVTLTDISAVYKIARRAGQSAIMTLTQEDAGITVSGSTVTVEYNTEDVNDGSTDAVQFYGLFFDQLQITEDDDALYVCEGEFVIEQVIL